MSVELSSFLRAAADVGLVSRLSALRSDVDQVIATYPAGSRRYLARLEAQRARLQDPDLELIVRLVSVLCEEDPARLAMIAPIAHSLQGRFPALRPLARLAA